VLCFLAIPALIAFVVLAWFTQGDAHGLLLLLPGFIAMPVYALIPSLNGAVLLSHPTDEAKSAGRGLSMLGIIFLSMAIAGVATFAWSAGFFWHFVAFEFLISVSLYMALRYILNRQSWPRFD
jgi:hypothetical protein